jgi:hypothetical protein
MDTEKVENIRCGYQESIHFARLKNLIQTLVEALHHSVDQVGCRGIESHFDRAIGFELSDLIADRLPMSTRRFEWSA